MMSRRLARTAAAAAVTAAAAAIGVTRSEAHKPITSPYTYAEDVLPIVQARCGACHVEGGVAPMSLLTHAEAVPWGESMRAELMAGHMPPWPVDSAPGRFRNVHPLSGRELNVLLTWAAGGTPAGAAVPLAASPERDSWQLGQPDAILQLPATATLGADVNERVDEFTIPAPLGAARAVKAVDVLPGTRAIVRAATVWVRMSDDAQPPSPVDAGRSVPEHLLALWLPGDHPVPLDEGTALFLPAGAELVVRVHYRKTWEYERQEMSDRSSVGLYFTAPEAAEMRALPLAPPPDTVVGPNRTVAFATELAEPMQAVAIYPDAALAHARVVVTATRPDGSREELIAFRPRPGWARRYWYAQPIPLPRGTRIDIRASFDEDTLLPPGAVPPSAEPNAASVKLTLNVTRPLD